MRIPWILLLAGYAAVAQENSVPPAPTGEGILEVTVVNSATNEPVKKAAVVLYGPSSARSVQTDAGGKALFDKLPDGTFAVQANHANFPPRRDEHRQVELSAGMRRVQVKLALEPGSAITGRVVDEDGDPLLNCHVQAIRRDSSQQRRLGAVGSAQSHPDGTYRIYNLPSGRYLLAANCVSDPFTPQPFSRVPRPLSQVYAPQFYPDVRDLEAATRIQLDPGTERSGVDFRIGRTDATELSVRPIPPDLPSGIQMQVMLVPRGKLLESMNSMRGAALDPRMGAYRFDRVMAGMYEVIAYSIGSAKPFGGRARVEIDGSKPVQISLPVGLAPDLVGRIEMEGGSKTGLAQMKVTLEPRATFVFSHSQPVSVDQSGDFTLLGVAPGTWQVLVGPLPPHTYLKSVSMGDREALGGLLTVTEAVAPLRILIGGKPGSLEVSLEPSSTSDATVLIAAAGNPSMILGQMKSQGSEHAVFADLAPGRYLVAASEGTGRELQGVPEVLRRIAKEVEVEEGTRSTVTLKPISSEELKKALDEGESEH